jgi:hypothetical protein
MVYLKESKIKKDCISKGNQPNLMNEKNLLSKRQNQDSKAFSPKFSNNYKKK